jgi:hypothetical protein
MHFAPQSITFVEDTGYRQIGEGPSDSVNPDLPALKLLRRPAFAPSARGRLTMWYWLGWIRASSESTSRPASSAQKQDALSRATLCWPIIRRM